MSIEALSEAQVQRVAALRTIMLALDFLLWQMDPDNEQHPEQAREHRLALAAIPTSLWLRP